MPTHYLNRSNSSAPSSPKYLILIAKEGARTTCLNSGPVTGRGLFTQERGNTGTRLHHQVKCVVILSTRPHDNGQKLQITTASQIENWQSTRMNTISSAEFLSMAHHLAKLEAIGSICPYDDEKNLHSFIKLK